MASVAQILVVSCDPETRNVIETVSLSYSYQVTCVPSSQDAMLFVQRGTLVNLVLLDVDNRADDYESRSSLIEWSGNDRLCLLSSDISSVSPGIG